MIFQTLDDKQQCVGVYVDGRLHFEEFPKDLHQTWKYSAFTKNDDIEYAWIQCGGLSMEKACPDRLQEELETAWTQIQTAYDNDYARKRLAEYPSVDELVIALWEGVVEERMAAVTKLEGKRQAVKTKYPK